VIKVENISKTYGDKRAVDGLSFTVNDGEIVGFIGPNGAGKTTTIKMLTGIIEPEGGTIEINGNPMNINAIETKKIIGYISDSPDMFLRLTGLEFINFMADMYDVSEEDRRERIAHFSEVFGMQDSLGDRLSSFSHGMRQKTMLIAALVHDPKVWILDEPMVGLDPAAAYSLKQIMREHADKGNAVLYSTHVLEVAEKLCDKALIITHGRQHFFGTMEELKGRSGDSDLEQVFLEIMKDDDADVKRQEL